MFARGIASLQKYLSSPQGRLINRGFTIAEFKEIFWLEYIHRLWGRLIGVVFGLTGRFHMELLDGLYVAARRADYQLILSALTPRRNEREAVDCRRDRRHSVFRLWRTDMGNAARPRS